MMFALKFMAVYFGLKISLTNFLIHIYSQTEERGAGGGTRLFPQGKCPAFWLARHHAGRMPQAKVCFGA